MGHKKLIRFNAIKGFSNVLEYPESMAGRWKEFFGNENPLVLELACGKGEYTVGLARLYPQNNHIGVDVKGNRLFTGAKTALQEGLGNAAFLRTQIDRIAEYFGPAEVSEIWITFPDPQLRISRAKKRLTHPKFLRLYKGFLKEGGFIHLKTDSPALYTFTKRVIDMYGLELQEDIADLYAQPEVTPELAIKTYYESLDIAQANRVHYLRFRLPPGPLPELDKELQEQLKIHESGAERGS